MAPTEDQNQQARNAQMKAYFEADYAPTRDISAENRMANAADYSAYHLGQISRKLDRLIEAIHVLAQSRG